MPYTQGVRGWNHPALTGLRILNNVPDKNPRLTLWVKIDEKEYNRFGTYYIIPMLLLSLPIPSVIYFTFSNHHHYHYFYHINIL